LKLRTVVRIAGTVIGAVVAIVVLAVGGLWTFAETARGGDLLRRIALGQVNGRINGHLAIERLTFGGNSLALDDVVLRDPEGGPVARVGHLEVRFSPLALLRQHLDIRRLEIRRPELKLVVRPRGSNLARALAPAHPKHEPPEPKPDEKPSALVVDLQALALSDGSVTVVSQVPEIRVAAIAVDGSAHYEAAAATLRAGLRIATEGGRIEADGTLDLQRMQPADSGFAVRVRQLNLAKLMREMPVSGIDVDLTGHGQRLAVDLDARAPGVTVSGHGALDGDRLEDTRLRVDARDLAATARCLQRCGLAPPLALSGNGRIDLALSGPRARPSLRLAARIPDLRVGDNAVKGLTVSAAMPRLDQPERIDLQLAAASARVAGRSLRGLSVTAGAAGPTLALHLKNAGPYPLVVDAGGRRLAGRAMQIDRFVLRYPEESWSIARPVRLELGDRLAVEGLDLRAGGNQSIRADLSKTARGGHLRLAIAHLELGRLPRVLIPAAIARAGQVTTDADVRFSAARLAGHLSADALDTHVDATFDLPTAWPPPGRSPMKLALTTGDTDLAAVAKVAAAISGQPSALSPRGHAKIDATLDGSAARPRLAVDLDAHGLALAGRTLGDLTLAVRGEDGRPIEARFQSSTPGTGHEPPAQVSLTARVPLSLHEILHRRPPVAALEKLPFEVQGDIKQLPLSLVGQLTGGAPAVKGTVSAQIAAHGTARAPEGTVGIDLTGVTTRRIPPTDARVELTLARHTTQLNVRVVRKQHPLLALEARLQAGLEALLDRARLETAPLQVRAVVGPLTIKRRGLAADLSGDELGTGLQGQLHADLAIDGTLRAPRLLAHVQADDLKMDQQAIGFARVEARYDGGQARVVTRLVSANGGALALEASTRADLSLPAIQRGAFDARHTPIEVSLRAHALDLRGLSGVTDTVRGAAGLLEADLRVRGTIATPAFSGRLECKGCELQLNGVGDFREMHLALHGDNDKIVLDDLSARSGDGHAHVSGDLSHDRSSGAYALLMRVEAENIPVYSEGQPLAAASINAQLTGSTGVTARGQGTIAIRDAHITLSDEKRRQLQPLKPLADVVLVDGGHGINRAETKKLKAFQAKREGAGAPAEDTAGAKSSTKSSTGAGPLGRVRITVDAPRKLWVNGHGARLELGVASGFHVDLGHGDPQVFGEIQVLRGRVDAFGRRFDLKGDTSLQFDGPPDYPTLDATATYQDNDDNVTVTLTAKGPIDHLSIGISSPNRPDLNQSQLYTLIITGHLPGGTSDSSSGGTGAAAANEASALIAGAIASSLQKTLSKRLPLDVLTIDAGSGQGLTGTQLEAGRYVTDKLYVGYVGRIGANPALYQNRNAVHVEYELGARWQIAGEYGDVGTGSADLIWKKNY